MGIPWKFLKQLGVPRPDFEGLTKNEASALITAKVEEKKMAPPTTPQLKMLKVSTLQLQLFRTSGVHSACNCYLCWEGTKV